MSNSTDPAWRILKNLFDSISDAIYIQNEDGRFLEVNHGAEEMYGYKRDFFIGESPEFLAADNKVDLESDSSVYSKGPKWGSAEL